MTKGDGTTQRKQSINISYSVTYHPNGDDNDKKSKSNVQIQNDKIKKLLP